MISLFRNFVRYVLVEGKVDDVIKQYSYMDLDRSSIEKLYNSDPSPTKKYFLWMVKQFVAGSTLFDIIPSIEFFHRNPMKFTKRDINAYRDAHELEDAVKEASSKVSSTAQRKQIKADGAAKIYEDDNVTVVRIDSKQAAMAYGAGTKWCITMASASYYEEYVANNVIFHFILRKQPLGDNFDKVAAASYRDKNNTLKKIEFFDVEDNSYGTLPRKYAKSLPNVAEIIAIIHVDTRKRPKSFMMRLKSDENVTDEELKQFWMSVESRNAQWSLFMTIPKKYRQQMLSFIDDEQLHDVTEGIAHFEYEDDMGDDVTAIIYTDAEGKELHREDGPAKVYSSGTKMWYQNGKRHREDGPATELRNGTKIWYINGLKHREDGPAIVNSAATGYDEYYLNGIEYSKEEFDQMIASGNFERPKSRNPSQLSRYAEKRRAQRNLS